MSKPISILTPVYDRKRFLDLMIMNILCQDYPKEKIEWCILDSYGRNGDISTPMLNDNEIKEIKKILPGVAITYKFIRKALDIGEKRNMLVKMARNNTLVNMDSDDFYLKEYCTTIVNELDKPNITIAGSPEMMFIYPLHDYKMAFIQCASYRQIHEGCMGFTKKHWRRMGGFNAKGTGEGAGLFDNCVEKYFSKISVENIMICVCHDTNTCPKDKFLNSEMEGATMEGSHMDLLKHMFKDYPTASRVPVQVPAMQCGE